jgi:hypothetical protein
VPIVPASPEPSQAKIDKSVLALSEPKRNRDKAHLRFVGSHAYLDCARQPSDAHHLRFAQSRAIGMKVSDEFTVPLCREHHRHLHHARNEIAWWHNLSISPPPIALELWTESQVIWHKYGFMLSLVQVTGRGFRGGTEASACKHLLQPSPF